MEASELKSPLITMKALLSGCFMSKFEVPGVTYVATVTSKPKLIFSARAIAMEEILTFTNFSPWYRHDRSRWQKYLLMPHNSTTVLPNFRSIGLKLWSQRPQIHGQCSAAIA